MVNGQVTHPAVPPAVWRCKGDAPGQFFPFDAGIANMFEQAMTAKSPVNWQNGAFNYQLDWNTFEQVNLANGTRRGIQRVVNGQVTHPAAPASASAPGNKLLIQVPVGATSGMTIQVRVPDGRMVS